MIRFRFRSTPPGDPTPDQRERMAVFSVSGETEGPASWLAQRHLMFARHLVEHGRIGEDVTSAVRARVWPDAEMGAGY